MNTLEQQANGGGVWMTIAELARRKGISRQAAAKRVDRLEADGQISTRQTGRNREVELASFDRAVGQTGNAYREQSADTRREMSSESPSQAPVNAALRDAQTEQAQYTAKLKALDLAERTGALVPIKGAHGVEAALVKAAEGIVRDLGSPLNWVSEIMESVREGEPALRRLLRRKIAEQRQSIAGRLAMIAGEAASADVTVDLDIGEDE